MNNRISIVILAACMFFTHWRANATDESGLIGSWTPEDSGSIYEFAKDHVVGEWWVPKDQPVGVTFEGEVLNVIQLAARAGHWKLDGEQLVITMESETAPDWSGKDTTVHLSSKQGTTSWSIVSDSGSTMTWSNTTSRAGVSRSVELKLRRIVHH
jgi:hypothetical protein